MHDARFIANLFIEMARQAGRTLTPMQLLKLVYIAHGWMLGLYGVPLIRNRVEAWKFGPVIPDLYRAVRHCGDGPVIASIPVPQEELIPVERQLIEQVFSGYGARSGISLSSLTHQPGTPWAQVYRDDTLDIPITNDIIQEHYQQIATERS